MNPPTRYYWLWKKCRRAKSDSPCDWKAYSTLKQREKHSQFCILYALIQRNFQELNSLLLWTIAACCWLCRVSLSRVADSSFASHFFMCIYLKKSLLACIVPAHCFAWCFYQQTRVSPSLSKTWSEERKEKEILLLVYQQK